MKSTEKIDLMDSIDLYKTHFTLHPDLWDGFSDSIKSLLYSGWNEIKYYDNTLNKSTELKHIPNDTGGIYLFLVKPNIIPDTHLYLMYIGRARLTKCQNLRKRCGEYHVDERPKIKKLFKRWGKYLYVKYLPLTDNEVIDSVEKELINRLLPPCNDRIPDVITQAATSAFL